MKPPPHAQGEGSWGHEVRRAIGDRLRKAYDATLSPSALRGGLDPKTIDEMPKSSGFDRRVGSGPEDPIRRVMFLGPWSHTWACWIGLYAWICTKRKEMDHRLMISFLWINDVCTQLINIRSLRRISLHFTSFLGLNWDCYWIVILNLIQSWGSLNK